MAGEKAGKSQLEQGDTIICLYQHPHTPDQLGTLFRVQFSQSWHCEFQGRKANCFTDFLERRNEFCEQFRLWAKQWVIRKQGKAFRLFFLVQVTDKQGITELNSARPGIKQTAKG